MRTVNRVVKKESPLFFLTAFIFMIVLLTVTSISAQGLKISELVPPPEPKIKPIVSPPNDVDKNNNKIDDSLENKIAAAKKILADTKSTVQVKAKASKQLEERVKAELIFSKQITKKQIDDFIAASGTIDYIYKSVGYGWTCTIPLKNTEQLLALMGNTFLGIVEAKKITATIDEAGQCGRVRPVVWNAGYDGDQSETSSKITIAILDTGIDSTHPDLSGRGEYWADFSGEGYSNPADPGHHGSHVAGIACGTGQSSGISPSTISFMHLGTFPSSGFYKCPFHINTSLTSFNWTSTMHWDSANGSRSTTIGQCVFISTGSDYTYIGSPTTGTTDTLINTNTSIANPVINYSNRYSSTPMNNYSATYENYAVVNDVSYKGPDDGYYLFRGIAPDCKWAGIKVLDDTGSGYSSYFCAGVDAAVTQRLTHSIKVGNMSLSMNGDPGINTSIRNKVNTAALNGIVMCISAGNEGNYSGGQGEVNDPGRCQYAITVGASSDVNQLTDFSAHGFNAPGDSNSGDDDMKPDIIAPGGSLLQSLIFSVDSNDTDVLWYSKDIPDVVPNNYLNIYGTSMSAPYMAGCAALIIDALQKRGYTWNYTLDDVLKVKMLLLMTAAETNTIREVPGYGDPTLDRGLKDIHEGYGMVNADAAIDAAAGTPYYDDTTNSFSSNPYDRRCWARELTVTTAPVSLSLTVPATGDFDMYIYQATPDQYGNPVILTSSTNEGLDADESIDSWIPPAEGPAYLVIKRVSGNGSWHLIGSGMQVPVELRDFFAE